MDINYIEGDLFANLPNDKNVVIAHVCNNKGGWGSGFVIPLAKWNPQTKQEYLDWFNLGDNWDTGAEYPTTGPFRLGEVQFVKKDNILTANMVAQTLGGVRPLFYNKLVHCMEKVANVAVKRKCEIYAPLFGSGLAGGNWEFIQCLIRDIWLNNDIPVTVFWLRQFLPVGWVPPNFVQVNEEGSKDV